MSELAGLGIIFEETLSGWVGVGETDFSEGRIRGQRENTFMRLDPRIKIPSVQQFVDEPDHLAHVEGTVTFTPLGGPFEMRHGVFSLFSAEPKTGIIQMTYSFRFTASGKNYFAFGRKNMKHHAGRIDVFNHLTTLYTKVYEGEDDKAPVYAAGVVLFKFWDFVPLMIHMKIPGAQSLRQRLAAKKAFVNFSLGVLAKEYL